MEKTPQERKDDNSPQGAVSVIPAPGEDRQQVHDFIFDDEIIVSADRNSLEGYLWATEYLVDRLKSQEKKHLTAEELGYMENINFYPVYDLRANSITLEGHYYLDDGYWATGRGFSLSLSPDEVQIIISAFEEYCERTEGTSCLAFLNEVRAGDGMEKLPEFKDRLARVIRAMSAAGWEYDTESNYRFYSNDYGGSMEFDSIYQAEEWLDGVVLDHPAVGDAVQQIMHPERFTSQGKPPLAAQIRSAQSRIDSAPSIPGGDYKRTR